MDLWTGRRLVALLPVVQEEMLCQPLLHAAIQRLHAALLRDAQFQRLYPHQRGLRSEHVRAGDELLPAGLL